MYPTCLTSTDLAVKLRRPGNLVRLAISSGLAVLVVDANEDAGVVGGVGTWEAHGLTTGARARATDINLSAALLQLLEIVLKLGIARLNVTYDVELSSTLLGGRV